MYRLEILIPQYKENEAVVKYLLNSIAQQANKSLLSQVRVIICNDGSNVRLGKKFLEKYPFPINYFIEEHGGISATRNKLLDHATAEYIMYCDADDMFYRADALDIIFKNIDEKHFDLMQSHFLEEVINPENNQSVLLLRSRGLTFVHGKVYRRQFLIDNNVRWNERLTIHEDSYFNFTAHAVCKNVYVETTPFYLWKYRADSVARRDRLFHLTSYNNLLDSESALLHEYIRRDLYEHVNYQITFILIKGYYITNSKDWIEWDDRLAKLSALNKLKYLYKKFKLCYFNRDMEVEKTTWVNVKADLSRDFILDEDRISFIDWLNQFEKQYIE